MVPGMGRNDDPLRSPTLGKSGGDREHNAVAKRDDRTLHRFLLVVTVRNGTAATQEIGPEFPCDESEGCDAMRNAEQVALPSRHRELLGMMLRPVVKTERGHHLVSAKRIMQGRDGIESATHQDDDLHRRPVFAFEPS